MAAAAMAWGFDVDEAVNTSEKKLAEHEPAPIELTVGHAGGAASLAPSAATISTVE